MMTSEGEKRKYLEESYDKYHNSITKSELLRTAMYLQNKRCCFSVSKKDKIKAYHYLMKQWLFKVHNQLLDLNNIQLQNQAKFKKVPVASYP